MNIFPSPLFSPCGRLPFIAFNHPSTKSFIDDNLNFSPWAVFDEVFHYYVRRPLTFPAEALYPGPVMPGKLSIFCNAHATFDNIKGCTIALISFILPPSLRFVPSLLRTIIEGRQYDNCNRVEVMRPPTTTTASGFCISEPIPEKAGAEQGPARSRTRS